MVASLKIIKKLNRKILKKYFVCIERHLYWPKFFQNSVETCLYSMKSFQNLVETRLYSVFSF